MCFRASARTCLRHCVEHLDGVCSQCVSVLVRSGLAWFPVYLRFVSVGAGVAAMRVCFAFVLYHVAAAIGTRKPADMSDVVAVADFASSAADLFLGAAKALPSPTEAQAALAAADEHEMHAMLAADAADRRVSGGSAASFLSAPSSSLAVANVRFVEPADAGSQHAASARKRLDAALAALEARQRSSDNRFATALGWTSSLARQF